jgi:hypothetical protein
MLGDNLRSTGVIVSTATCQPRDAFMNANYHADFAFANVGTADQMHCTINLQQHDDVWKVMGSVGASIARWHANIHMLRTLRPYKVVTLYGTCNLGRVRVRNDQF